jgi:ligand-binding sensor domain-containing protein
LREKAELETAPNISEPILALTTEFDSQLWAVGLDGVYHYDNSGWVKVISTQELPVRGWLQAVTQGVKDRVWLGTSTGLLVYTTDTKKLTPISGHLGSADVRSLLAIFHNESELVWIGTSLGLYVGKVDCWEAVTNLENRTITALAWDGNTNSLWVGTDKGLFRVVHQGNNWN